MTSKKLKITRELISNCRHGSKVMVLFVRYEKREIPSGMREVRKDT